jgi:hypothetical protein
MSRQYLMDEDRTGMRRFMLVERPAFFHIPDNLFKPRTMKQLANQAI